MITNTTAKYGIEGLPEYLDLLDVQQEALRRSTGHFGFAWFMEQGLGKTLTTFAEFLRLLTFREATRLVIVCPNSFKGGWVDDAKKHGIDDKFDFFIWEAGNESGLRWWMKQEYKKPPCLIVNYESIRAEATKVKGKSGKMVKAWKLGKLGEMINEFIAGKNAMIAFDESIKISTHDSAQTMGALLVVKDFRYSRILSGKPIKQGPHDLWSQMRAIFQLNGRNYFAFKTAFCKMGGFMMKQVMSAQNEDILSVLIEPHVFRATKTEWTDLPPKLWPPPRMYKMTPEMQTMYNAMEHEFVLWLNETENVAVDAAITKYIKLAQIQCGWVYKEDGSIHQLVPDERNPRLQMMLEIIDDELTSKAAIVYHHKPVFDQLLRNLGGVEKCAWIRGGMSPAEITEQKRRFNEDKEVRFILLQDDASKYGHTLLGLPEPGHQCYTMIFYENNYSLDTRSQTEDRIHRHGQTADSVLYLDLSGTQLDRDCVKALQRKENIFQAVFANIH